MAAVSGDAAIQDQVLEDLEDAVNYRRWLCELALPYLGGSALEIGSGLGYYAATWLALGERVTASEGSPARVEALRARLAATPAVPVRVLHAPVTESAGHSAVVAYNVLEHIPDDVAALRSFAGLVRSGGRIVLIVPAFEAAMSEFDRAIGHQRRYTVASLRETLERAGLRVERIHYVNSVGLLAWIVIMKWLNGRPRAGFLLRFWDALVIPVVRFVERRVAPPFGQSVFAVAAKTDRVQAGAVG